METGGNQQSLYKAVQPQTKDAHLVQNGCQSIDTAGNKHPYEGEQISQNHKAEHTDNRHKPYSLKEGERHREFYRMEFFVQHTGQNTYQNTSQHTGIYGTDTQHCGQAVAREHGCDIRKIIHQHSHSRQK